MAQAAKRLTDKIDSSQVSLKHQHNIVYDR